MKPVNKLGARRLALASAALLVASAAPLSSAAVFTWTGNGGQSWGTNANWNPSGGPAAADMASFTDVGSLSLPGEVTSVLNANRTIGGLSFANSTGRHHTLDLATRTLTVTGNLHFNTDVNASSVASIRNGALVINSPFASLNVGRAASGSANGTADLTGLSSFTATLQDVHVGSSTAVSATGNLSLPATTSITAQRVWVGTANASQGTIGTLRLGANTTLLASEWRVGKDNGIATVDAVPGGAVQIGSATQRTLLLVGVANTETNAHYGGTLDLSGGAVTAFLGDVIVGQRTGIGGGRETGTFVAGNAGTVQIGSPTSLANFVVGRRLAGDGAASATGSVDFSGLSSLEAHLSTLAVGTALDNTGISQGTVKLPASNAITADTIVVGSHGKGHNILTLGRGTNTILANHLIVGQDFASGTVSVPPGATVNLGSPGKRTSLTLGVGVTGDSNTNFTGTLDLGGATLVAYLDAVTIGSKDPRSGTQAGIFTISSRAENRVEASSIFLGGPSGNGTLNFGGGQLVAGSITRGPGTANFNWAGGRLSVTRFGAPATPFNLTNTGSGTLAPGTASAPIGTATVHGNYSQGPFASLAIDIAGASSLAGNDLLSVTGTASLGGTLSLELLNNFSPSLDQSYLIAAYASRSGAFSFVDPPKLPSGVAFQLDYAPAQLFVRMVPPTVQTWAATAATGTFGSASSWNAAGVPTSTSTLLIGNALATPRTITVSDSATVHRVSLQGEAGPLTLLVPAGIRLGVANQVIVGPGATLAGGGSVLGDVVVTGGGALSPGSSPGKLTLGGAVGLEPGSALRIELAGTALGAGYDQLDVAGSLALAGTLAISRAGGFLPSIGDAFEVLSFASRSGDFDQITGYDFGRGLYLRPVYSPTRLALVTTQAVPGDADLSGVVNADDFLLTDRGFIGRLNGWGNGDFNHDGAINIADYFLLDRAVATQAGPAGPAGLNAASVPEPVSAFISFGIAAFATGRRARRTPPG